MAKLKLTLLMFVLRSSITANNMPKLMFTCIHCNEAHFLLYCSKILIVRFEQSCLILCPNKFLFKFEKSLNMLRRAMSFLQSFNECNAIFELAVIDCFQFVILFLTSFLEAILQAIRQTVLPVRNRRFTK